MSTAPSPLRRAGVSTAGLEENVSGSRRTVDDEFLVRARLRHGYGDSPSGADPVAGCQLLARPGAPVTTGGGGFRW